MLEDVAGNVQNCCQRMGITKTRAVYVFIVVVRLMEEKFWVIERNGLEPNKMSETSFCEKTSTRKPLVFPHTCDYCGRDKPTQYYVLADDSNESGLTDKGAELCKLCAWKHRRSILYSEPKYVEA